MSYDVERRLIIGALEQLVRRLEHESGDVDLADAIDHLGAARDLLTPSDEEDEEQNPRTKGDDDGQEYGDPRDYRDGKE